MYSRLLITIIVKILIFFFTNLEVYLRILQNFVGHMPMFNWPMSRTDHVHDICFCVLFVGVMKLEATKFRPREVVKHVLQTAAASLKKDLTLEGNIADEVPILVSTQTTNCSKWQSHCNLNFILFSCSGGWRCSKDPADSHQPDQQCYQIYTSRKGWDQTQSDITTILC